MKTSEISRALKGEIEWQSFIIEHKAERARLLSRKDGAVTSGDLGLQFDAGEVVVTNKQIEVLCNAILKSEIDAPDGQFVANAIALSGFQFESEDAENALFFLSSFDSTDVDAIHQVAQMLRSRK
jgi:predicted cupin superfamily sugar epimerase